jgi:hypothetical protein
VEINPKVTISFLLSAVFAVLLIACGDTQPVPGIEIAVEGTVAEERAARTTVSGLVVECALDEMHLRISCGASGFRAGSQLTWTSTASRENNRGNRWDFTVDSELTERPARVFLEECQGSDCQTIETLIDLSGRNSSHVTGPTATPRLTESAATATSALSTPMPFLSLPFSLDQEPEGIMPMGETINHEAPRGHPGIDFQWDNKASVLIAASGEVAEIVLLPHSQNLAPDLVVHSILVLTNEYMVIYEVTDVYSFNPDIAVGSKVTTGQILGYALDIGSGDGWHMIHWAFGNYRKIPTPITTPEGETRNYFFSYLCPVPYFTDAERGRLSRVWESALYEHKERFPEVCNGPYKNY